MKKLLFPIIIFTAVISLYYPALFTYFSQDDFFHFKVSQTDGSIFDFINLFGFHSFDERGIAFYRPISRELPFHLFYILFGLNPLPFRILTFSIHFINIYLVYILTSKLLSKNLAFFVSFFFGITAANMATLNYLAGGIQTIMATAFTLTSILFFHQYLITSALKYKIIAFLTFLLAISSHEQAIIIPFLFIGLIFILKIKNIKSYLLNLLPYFVLIFLLLMLEIFVIGFSANEQQYKVVFSIKTTLNSFLWYASWAMGIPETLIDFVLPGLKLNPTLLRYWGNYYLFIFPSFSISLLLILIAAIYLLIKKGKIFTSKTFILCMIWFPLGLLPIILLPLHKSTHYLTISLPAFWIIVGIILFNFYHEIKHSFISKIFIFLFVSSLIILSVTSALLGSTNYWAASRGKLAKQIITEVKNTYPTLPKGAIIYFKNDQNYPFITKEWGGTSKQASLVLNRADALQLLYKDPTLNVYYEDFNRTELSGENVYPIVAKFY